MHEEYKRISENATKAILFIHGILGTPNHFEEFVSLVPNSISVYNILLDGHGKSAADFSHTSMKKWEVQVEGALEELAKNHSEICIVAHSLGCLLALDKTADFQKISKMLLLAVPLKISLKPRLFLNSIKIYLGKESKSDELKAAKRCYGIKDSKNPLHYLGWIPRFAELFAKIRKVRKILPLIKVNCKVFQSLNDETVSKRSFELLVKNNNFNASFLEGSGHFYYPQADFDILKSTFSEFIL